jgi:large subunit ribosomal protein L1
LPIDAEAINKAIKKVRDTTKKRKFKQSIDMSINLKDLDMSKPESKINLEVVLPKPVPKQVKICALAYGEMVLKAKQAGADKIVEREEIEKLGGDKKKAKKLASQYDFFIARSDLMPLIGKNLGPVLGPRGKMPTPMAPNADPAPVIQRLRHVVRIKLSRSPTAAVRVGTEDMKDAEIAENMQKVIDELTGKLERGDRNIKSVYIKTTMGSPVKLETGRRSQ